MFKFKVFFLILLSSNIIAGSLYAGPCGPRLNFLGYPGIEGAAEYLTNEGFNVFIKKRDFRLRIERPGYGKYKSVFLVSNLRAKTLENGSTYAMAWFQDKSQARYGVNIVNLSSTGAPLLKSAEVSQQILDAFNENPNDSFIGRITITSVRSGGGEYRVFYNNSLNKPASKWMDEGQIERLKQAAKVKRPEDLAGFSRVILAPESEEGGTDWFVIKLLKDLR